MRALVLTPEFPFPPRNGVTIPVANYIRLLRDEGFAVDVAYYSGGDLVPDKPLLSGRQIRLTRTRPILRAIAAELCLIRPFSCTFTTQPENWIDEIVSSDYELVLASPINMVAVANGLVHALRRSGKNPRYIAAISDCYTAELRNSAPLVSFGHFRLPSASRVRSFYMGIVERKLLALADEIFVQSANDRAWLVRLSHGTLSPRIRIATNGVDDSLLTLPIDAHAKAVNYCFIANFASRDYRQKLLWLHQSVWSDLHVPGKRLHVIGSGLPKDDPSFARLYRDHTVVIRDAFTPDIVDVYRGMHVLLAPIFKSYGFINKVGEAMAAGVAVVGDETAFNGIVGFSPGHHAVVANTAESMVRAAEALHCDAGLLHSLRINGRQLAQAELRWTAKRDFFSRSFPNMNDCRGAAAADARRIGA